MDGENYVKSIFHYIPANVIKIVKTIRKDITDTTVTLHGRDKKCIGNVV
jgi:hypothetical protein